MLTRLLRSAMIKVRLHQGYFSIQTTRATTKSPVYVALPKEGGATFDVVERKNKADVIYALQMKFINGLNAMNVLEFLDQEDAKCAQRKVQCTLSRPIWTKVRRVYHGMALVVVTIAFFLFMDWSSMLIGRALDRASAESEIAKAAQSINEEQRAAALRELARIQQMQQEAQVQPIQNNAQQIPLPESLSPGDALLQSLVPRGK